MRYDQSECYSKLVDRVCWKDLDLIDDILRDNDDLNLTYQDGRLFVLSVENGSVEIVKTLLTYFENNQLNKYPNNSKEYWALKHSLRHILERAVTGVNITKEMKDTLAPYVDFEEEKASTKSDDEALEINMSDTEEGHKERAIDTEKNSIAYPAIPLTLSNLKLLDQELENKKLADFIEKHEGEDIDDFVEKAELIIEKGYSFDEFKEFYENESNKLDDFDIELIEAFNIYRESRQKFEDVFSDKVLKFLIRYNDDNDISFEEVCDLWDESMAYTGNTELFYDLIEDLDDVIHDHGFTEVREKCLEILEEDSNRDVEDLFELGNVYELVKATLEEENGIDSGNSEIGSEDEDQYHYDYGKSDYDYNSELSGEDSDD